MTDVYDIKTGKKLETISYGNNRQKKEYYAKTYNNNKYMTASQAKEAQRQYNLLMKSICDSMMLRGE